MNKSCLICFCNVYAFCVCCFGIKLCRKNCKKNKTCCSEKKNK